MTGLNTAFVLALDLEDGGIIHEVTSVTRLSRDDAEMYQQVSVRNFAMIKAAVLLPVLQKLSMIEEIHMPDRDMDIVLVVYWRCLLAHASCLRRRLPTLVFRRQRMDLACMTAFGDSTTQCVSCVRAYRGQCNEVDERHERLLRDIRMFFQRRILVGEGEHRLEQCRILSMPWVSDWYESMSDVPTRWVLEQVDEEQELFRYVSLLYSLGIPTLLHEELHQRHLHKFWISAKASLEESRLGADRVGIWTKDELIRIKLDFVKFIVEGMIETARDFFGTAAVCKQLVAVLDASGYCERMAREIMSIRVCFQRLTVSRAQLLQCRKVLVSRLDGAWKRKESLGWEASLQALSSQEGGDEKTERRSLWEAVLQSPDSPQPLVWCEAASGLSNDQRPLEPMGLFVTDADGKCGMDQVVIAATPEQWCLLGSILSNEEKTTLDVRILVC